MAVQLRKLISEPCGSVANCPPPVFIIDGLDECEDEDVQRQILHLIGTAARQQPNAFRFLISSRPEAHIREFFEDPSFNGILGESLSFSPVPGSNCTTPRPDARQYDASCPYPDDPTLCSSSNGPRLNQQGANDRRPDSPSLHGGTFITVENVNKDCRGEAGMNTLYPAVVLEALHDSADNFSLPTCLAEARTETILDTLLKWAMEENASGIIRWLTGPAGAGRSAIMQSLSQKLLDLGRLGGSFFFKRGHPTRGNAKALFTTLAYQLALNNRILKPLVSQSVEDDPAVVKKQMAVQLRKLISEPCGSIANCPPPVFLIDGLDECENEDVQRQILYLIGTAARQQPNAFRFLVATRPKAYIREFFKDPSFNEILGEVTIAQGGSKDASVYRVPPGA
ncbi:hypothetical protein B0H14DRAFT_2736470 [Mycena olivaceomarginata]|nr:hypothetical protein B0H14DRAFT_2736470 [Mycena olivaceomarginata]